MKKELIESLNLAGIYHEATGQCLREQDIGLVKKYSVALAAAVAEYSLSAQDEVLTLHADKLLGLMVSMDVSTCDADAADRIFGKVIAMMPTEDGIVILAEEESRNCAAAAPSPAVAVDPVAYGAFYTGGRRAGKLYAHCDTKEQIDAYIADVHQRNDTITLRSGPLYLAATPPSLAVRDGVVDDLAILVRRLVRSLEKSNPGTDLAPQALDYLKRNGLEGSPLRDDKPNADCSGEPANCPDNEGYGCACDPMNKAAMREQQHADQG